MVRSTGVPRDRPLGHITKIIGLRSATKTISRVTETVGSLDQTETSTADHTEDVWLFEPFEAPSEVVAGERVNGDLMGLAMDDADIERDDRITHGTAEYEVDTVVGRPNDDNTSYLVITLVRRST